MRIRLFFCFIVSLVLTLPGRAQERVRNVRLRAIDSSQIEIRYDLVEARPGDSVYVRVESRWRGELLMLPEFIRGDIGKRLTVGSDRRIVWNALANGYALNEDIRATVLVKTVQLVRINAPVITPTDSVTSSEKKPSERSAASLPTGRDALTSGVAESTSNSRKTRYAGPAWALLSAVAPGLGNIFVQRPKPKIGLRPLVTVGCYGLFLFGLTEQQKATNEYAIYEQQKNITAAEPYYQTANRHHQTYFMATRGAVVVAAADVVLTFLKGLRNSELQKKHNSGRLFLYVQECRPGSLRPLSITPSNAFLTMYMNVLLKYLTLLFGSVTLVSVASFGQVLSPVPMTYSASSGWQKVTIASTTPPTRTGSVNQRATSVPTGSATEFRPAYTGDFVTNRNHWPAGNRGDYSYQIGLGSYSIRKRNVRTEKNAYSFVSLPTEINLNRAEVFTIKLDVLADSGQVATGGLLFGVKDSLNYCAFTTNSRGDVSIKRVANGETFSDYMSGDFFRPGVPVDKNRNRLMVKRRGEYLYFYVNDQEVRTSPYVFRIFPGNGIGLTSSGYWTSFQKLNVTVGL